MKSSLVVGFAAILTGCAPSLQSVPLTPTVITDYKIGEIRSAGIGDAVFDVQSARKIPEFVALRSYDPGGIRGLRGHPKVANGDRYRAVWSMKTGDYVIRNRTDTTTALLVVAPDGRALGYWDGKSGAVGGKWPQEPLFAGAESLEGQEGVEPQSGLDPRPRFASSRGIPICHYRESDARLPSRSRIRIRLQPLEIPLCADRTRGSVLGHSQLKVLLGKPQGGPMLAAVLLFLFR